MLRTFLLFSVFLVSPLMASSVLPMNLADLVVRSENVFEGICISLEHNVTRSADGKVEIPVIIYTFRAKESLKGSAKKQLVIRHLGQYQDGRTFLANPDQLGIPRYQVGKSYLLFMGKETATGLSVPIGLRQGVFRIQGGLAFNQESNQHILEGLTLGKTRYASLIEKNQEQQLSLAHLKGLVKDMLTGKVQLKGRQQWGEK